MLLSCRTRILFPVLNGSLNPVLSPRRNQRPKPPKTLKMEVSQSKSRRPTCPSCSRPSQLCLCVRIRTPNLENLVSVTILQHSLETKHPLNSARIARLGLKNVTEVTVFDVNHDARFIINLVKRGSESGMSRNALDYSDSYQVREGRRIQKFGFDSVDEFGSRRDYVGDFGFKDTSLTEYKRQCSLESDLSSGTTQNYSEGLNCVRNPNTFTTNDLLIGAENNSTFRDCIKAKGSSFMKTHCEGQKEQCDSNVSSHVTTLDKTILNNRSNSDNVPYVDNSRAVCEGSEAEVPGITATIGKYGAINDLSHIWMMTKINYQKPSFDHILACCDAMEALSNGFVVKKYQKQKKNWSEEIEEHEEFELEVPAGSVLLFPSEKALGVDKLKDMEFEVKNLIVLDGTWAKARRMYSENPWLKLLPHLKLDLNKMSLYGEVRQQPKAGYLSTIESIVYSFKTLGNNFEGLDDLLDVFESLVVDQRRCKDERLSKAS